MKGFAGKGKKKMSDFHLAAFTCLSADAKEREEREKKKTLIGFLASLATHDRPLEVNKPPITQVAEGGF